MADTMQVFERWVSDKGLKAVRDGRVTYPTFNSDPSTDFPHRALICLPPEDMPRMYPGMQVWRLGGEWRSDKVSTLPYRANEGTWMVQTRSPSNGTNYLSCDRISTEPPRTTLSVPADRVEDARRALECAGIDVEDSDG